MLMNVIKKKRIRFRPFDKCLFSKGFVKRSFYFDTSLLKKGVILDFNHL